jgi:8-oxo-dGTP pyrophosphatase MutT (NUDIX family)
MTDPSKEKIYQAISDYQVQHHKRYDHLFSSENMKNLRQAAVIIPMLEHEGRWHVLLTQRSQELVEHRGQVAYPGGARERQDENLKETALREMYEEVGVIPRDVTVFGHLGDMPIITGYLVRLFVGEIPWPYELVINSDEVESAFIVPLNWLADPDHRTIQYRSYAGREIPVIFFDHFEGYQLWGASAEMTLALLSALNLGK